MVGNLPGIPTKVLHFFCYFYSKNTTAKSESNSCAPTSICKIVSVKHEVGQTASASPKSALAVSVCHSRDVNNSQANPDISPVSQHLLLGHEHCSNARLPRPTGQISINLSANMVSLILGN